MVDLDRAEPQPLEPRRGTGLADEARQVVAGIPVAEAPEVDAGQHDLAVPLRDAACDLAEHGGRAATARRAPHQRDDAEVARERAAVLDLHERANAIEARVRLDAADRPHVARDERGGLLAPFRDDDDVRRQPGEARRAEVGAAAGDVDATVRASGARRRLAALRDRLVRHAAGADHRDVGVLGPLVVAVAQQRLAHLVRVDVRDLAAQEVDTERRHRAGMRKACGGTDRRPSRQGAARPVLVAGQHGLLGEEVPRGHEHLGVEPGRERLHGVDRDVGDGRLHRRQLLVAGHELRVELDAVPGGVLERRDDRRALDVDGEHRRVAEQRRPDGEHARAAADVEQRAAARAPAGARGTAASSGARRCRTRGRDRSQRRARRRGGSSHGGPTQSRPTRTGR